MTPDAPAAPARPTLAWIVEMALWSVALPVFRRILPVQRLAALMWDEPATPGSPALQRATAELAAKLTRLRLRGRANCLERSLLAFRFLARAGAEPSLVLGAATRDGEISGHAWVVVDGSPVLESPAALDQFLPLVEFGRNGRPEKPPDDVRLPRVWR